MPLHVGFKKLLTFLLMSKVLGEDSCLNDGRCSASFVQAKISLVGCPSVVSTSLAREVAMFNCLGDTQCKALTCNIYMTKCALCFSNVISDLSFGAPPVGLYLKRRLLNTNLGCGTGTSCIDETYEIPDGMVAGDVVLMKVRIRRLDSFQIDFKAGFPTNEVVNYRARARCDDSCADSYTCSSTNCMQRYYRINSFKNGAWDPNYYIDRSSYSFKVGDIVELYFLVFSRSVTAYVNGARLYNYNTPFSANISRYLHIEGTIDVLELSI
ncbi:galectin-related protein precursor [Biomphalaria pfeifferi]|uniref:Galectin n=1 Tax=Biomphalaria pfeifferi TaxID=112525 RepID=A0AAD8FE37_BIOPF|nr:galectin-related protein precursor [Biomphalaria pfeifferi]